MRVAFALQYESRFSKLALWKLIMDNWHLWHKLLLGKSCSEILTVVKYWFNQLLVRHILGSDCDVVWNW